jgi:hypothetical protein
VKFIVVAVQVFRISFIAIFCDISCNQRLQLFSCNHHGSLAIGNIGLHTAIQSSPVLQLFLTKIVWRKCNTGVDSLQSAKQQFLTVEN